MSKDAKSLWFGVLGAVVAGVLLWMFTTAASGGIVTGTRFKTDSVRRDQREARRDSIAERISAQVTVLVCRPLPPAEREACLKK